jgi:hypothetical protein
MGGTAGVIRVVLLVDIVALALLALAYLRQRRLSWTGYFRWGLLALLVPVLGPFLVISRRPGEWDPSYSLANDARRIGQFFSRLLPEQPGGKKLGTLDRARIRRQKRRQSEQQK